MPCYFVSNGFEMPMTDEAFDLLWNSFPNTELTDGKTHSFREGCKTVASVGKPANAAWKKQDDGYYNNKSNDLDYFNKYYKEKRNSAECATYAVLT